MFGRGRLDRAGQIYGQSLRNHLSPWAQGYWDRWIEFFEPGALRPFYYRGTCGTFAMMMNVYIKHIVRLRGGVEALLEAASINEQRKIYEEVHDRFWTRSLRFAINRDSTLSMLGVPRAQRRQLEREYQGGIAQFVHDCLEAVFGRLPLSDNYFWRVYMTGQYTTDCCPEYLKPENFERLKAGLVDRIEVHTQSVQGFLAKSNAAISRFVLLDHMDWMAGYRMALLEEEWKWIFRRRAPGARVIWRSGGLHSDFVDGLRVVVDGRPCQVGEVLSYRRDLAQSLHEKCRVHTYGSFHIADMAA